ncbi:hypothetical protein [Piscinibacter sp. XHJ-5]|uniref:hypothetical protein n=1 Tax=Piscinibacter sp. XHJ-5 TaxID=3037797 RepID=UPI002452E55D|nr:hypothetical protein [Piscinibacter sp. XHJ-5]
MYRTFATLIAVPAALCIAPFPAHAQDAEAAAVRTSDAGCASAATLSNLQGRIVDKAVQGTVPLRQFVWRTRMIYQLDVMDTLAWIDQRRAALAACEQRTARVEPIAAARE